mgnify:CR=1 FL=1
MEYYKKNKLHLTDDEWTDSVALVWPNQNMGIKQCDLVEDLYCKLLVNLLQHKTKVFLFSDTSMHCANLENAFSLIFAESKIVSLFLEKILPRDLSSPHIS